MRHVIVGGGIAGTTLAEELRKRRGDDEVVLVSEEQHALYSRVLLPHYIKGVVPRERVFLKKESWYESQRIEWLRGTVARSLDTKHKHVLLSDGREMPFDTLTIATGADSRMAGGEPRGVSYLRTLDDADHLIELLRQTGGDAIAFGGGFVACEYVNIFAHAKRPTTLVMRGPWMFSNALDEQSGERIARHLEARGVRVLCNAARCEAKGEIELAGVITDNDREISCSLLGMGIGVEPNLSWIKNSGVFFSNGVRTDTFLKTRLENIYAIGDIAEFDDITAGRPRIVGNWMNALSQARTLARTLAGEPTPYRFVTSYATNVLGLEIVFVGDTSREHAEKIEVEKTDRGITQRFYRNNRIVGATLVGDVSERMATSKQIDSL